MKHFSKLILTIAILSITTACNNSSDKSKEKTTAQALSEIEQKGLASTKIIDTVFLGYKFGMTSEQVMDYTIKLEQEGKLKKDFSDKYYFEIDSQLGTKYKGNVFANYLDNKLVSIGLIFNDEPNPILVFAKLSDLYESKYGAYDILNQPLKDLDVYEKYWIRKNLKIELRSGVTDAFIEYIDLRFEKQKTATDSLEKINKKKELEKNL